MKFSDIIEELLRESGGEQQISDSMRFDWKNGKYYWVDDKKSTNINTSIATKEDGGKVKYGYKTFLLPRSGVMSYNLFDIKNFNVTQALKHGKGVNINDPERKQVELTPDESINRFKEYIGKYILRILNSKGYRVDVIMTPQSSSGFNKEIMKIVRDLYRKEFNSDVMLMPNAFKKSMKNISVDKEAERSNIKDYLMSYIEEHKISENIISNEVKELYKQISKWKIEENIQPTMKKIYKLWQNIESLNNQSEITDDQKEEAVKISMEIKGMMEDVRNTIGPEFYETKYFIKGDFHPEMVLNKWQIKHVSDSIRKTLYNIFNLTNYYDKKYKYVNKKGEEIKGVSKLIDRLNRNNKSILIFDDNLSSGATLDDVSYQLVKMGVNKDNIIVVTLGKVPQSMYNPKAAQKYKNI